jgi:hypothetical protein
LSAERREHLRQYLLACVRDSVLSWNDFKSPAFLDKVLKTLSADTRAVAKEFGIDGLLRVGTTLVGMAADVAGRRPR